MINVVSVNSQNNWSRLTCIILLIAASSTNPVAAEIYPKALAADSRMGELAYDPEQVFSIETKRGIATHIILDPKERIISSAAGSVADCQRQETDWCIVAQVGANELYVQPRTVNARRNNLQLTTSLRRYTFEFVQSTDSDSKRTPWFRVTFRHVPTNPPASAPHQAAPRTEVATEVPPPRNAPGASLPLAAALRLHVPSNYKVYPHPDIDLDRPVAFDRSRDWSSELSTVLVAMGIGVNLDEKEKIIRLTPIEKSQPPVAL